MSNLRNLTMTVLLLAMIIAGVGVNSRAAAAPQPPDSEVDRILDTLTAQAPEILEMARRNPQHRLVMSVEAKPDPQAKNWVERDFYQIYVGFVVQDGESGHRSRWATFLVHKDRNEILWGNYQTGNTHIPLADWRQFIYRSPAEGVNDWACLPYMRVGPIQPYSTIADLEKFFGADNLERRTVYGAEGAEKFDTTVVFPGTANELIVFWRDNKYGITPSSVSVRKEGAKWKTVHGIRIGTDLATLNEINGRPFSFYGFSWDYGGIVTGKWDGGVMSSMSGVHLVLRATRELPREYYGDRKVRSDSAELLPDGAQVRRIDVQLR